MVLWIVLRLPSDELPAMAGDERRLAAVILLSLLFPAYYMVVSWMISCTYARSRRRDPAGSPIQPSPPGQQKRPSIDPTAACDQVVRR
jgi:hypothetical protein